MGIYDRPIATAERLITAKGRACIWRAFEADIDNSKPWNPKDDTYTDYPVNIVFLPRGPQNPFVSLVQGSDVKTGKDYGLMSAVNFTPKLKAQIIDLDTTTVLRVVNSVDRLAPNGENIMYTLEFEANE